MATPVRIYVSSYCPFCDAAKRWFTSMGVEYETIDVTADAETRNWLVERTKMRTVPQIFIGDTPTGGYQETRALDAEGGLRPLFDAAGVTYKA